VDLWDQTNDDKGFVVVGGRGVANAQLKLPHERIMYREMFTKSKAPKQLLMTNFLLNGWKWPQAIVLIYKKNERFKELILKQTSTFISIHDTVLNIFIIYCYGSENRI
jgi:hypothetical protein